MAKAGNLIWRLKWVQSPVLFQAGRNCRLRHNVNAIDDGPDGVCVAKIWNRNLIVLPYNPGLLDLYLLNDRVRRIGSIYFRVIEFICRSCFA